MRRPFRKDQTDTAEEIQFPEEIQQAIREFNGMNRKDYRDYNITEEPSDQEQREFREGDSFQNQ